MNPEAQTLAASNQCLVGSTLRRISPYLRPGCGLEPADLLGAVLASMRGRRIVVVGDVVLDEYLIGGHLRDDLLEFLARLSEGMRNGHQQRIDPLDRSAHPGFRLGRGGHKG